MPKKPVAKNKASEKNKKNVASKSKSAGPSKKSAAASKKSSKAVAKAAPSSMKKSAAKKGGGPTKKLSASSAKKSQPAKRGVASKKPLAAVKSKAGAKAPAQKKAKVSAIPKGYHSITPYLITDNAAQAISFYKQVFQAKEIMRMDKPGGKVSHAELKIGDAKIMLADEFPEWGARGPHSFGGAAVSIHLYTKNVDATIKLAASKGAKVIMEPQDMFYGDRSGTIEDPFGHKWHVATHIEDVSKAIMKKRMASMANEKK